MHTDLSRRITQLICAADSLSPVALKSELLDLARHCQIVPGNRFLVGAVCGSLEGAATAVFGPLALLLVMTEPRRRQVYFAVLARLEADGAFEGSKHSICKGVIEGDDIMGGVGGGVSFLVGDEV